MTATTIRPRRRARRRTWVRPLVFCLVLAATFVIGIAFGQALHDNPKPGGTQTLVRTLHPLPLVPVAQNTVTVTVSKP